MSKRFQVVMATDGSCLGNPGPGGYAAIIVNGENELEVAGYVADATNCMMELKAVVEGTAALKFPCDIIVQTDSKYVVDGINNASVCYARGWKTKAGAEMANVDLWKQLTDLKVSGKHNFQAVWVKGHDGNVLNERCDKLARAQIKKNFMRG